MFMDKSFNDQELSDIMKEIEALEEDYKEEEPVKAGPVLQELSELPEAKAIPMKKVKEEHFVTKAPAAMSFKVQGDLTLDLEFEVGGKFVALQVAEDGLTIVLDGGMTFKVPVSEKKAA
jgi:hypothetical protein